MKKVSSLLIAGALLVLANTGCMNGKKMDDADMNRMADSMYNVKRTALMDSMKNDCNTNMQAWVQMKADSIYKADSAAAAMAHK